MTANTNLFAALRGAFPGDLDRVAIETDTGQAYTWRDLDRGTAMLANLLRALELPAGSRIAAHTDKSVEALMLYLATLRAGHVYLPLNSAYQATEVGYFIGDAEPAVVVCASRNFSWLSKIAFRAGTRHVFTLDDHGSGSRAICTMHADDGQHQSRRRPARRLSGRPRPRRHRNR